MSGHIQEKSFAVVAETRRRWMRAEKAAVVAETSSASVSSVARRHGIASSLVFRWRRELGRAGTSARGEAAVAFVPVMALPAPAASVLASPVVAGGIIEIELSCGHRVRVDGAVDGPALARVIAVLQGR